jgi:hypothetical protein
MAVNGSRQGLTVEQRRVLQMLAGSPNGCTEPALRAHGFRAGLPVTLVGGGCRRNHEGGRWETRRAHHGRRRPSRSPPPWRPPHGPPEG